MLTPSPHFAIFHVVYSAKWTSPLLECGMTKPTSHGRSWPYHSTTRAPQSIAHTLLVIDGETQAEASRLCPMLKTPCAHVDLVVNRWRGCEDMLAVSRPCGLLLDRSHNIQRCCHTSKTCSNIKRTRIVYQRKSVKRAFLILWSRSRFGYRENLKLRDPNHCYFNDSGLRLRRNLLLNMQ